MDVQPETDPFPIPALSPLIASIIHCVFLIIGCQVARHAADTLVTHRLARVAVEEFICTVQLCASNFELGVVTEVYGFSGYAIGLFLTSLAYSLTFQNGTADPSECLFNLCKRQITAKEFVIRSVFSVAGAVASHRVARLFWAFKLVPEHAIAYEGAQICTASLQVSVLLGLAFELGETLVNRVMQNTDGYNMLGGALGDVSITFFGLFVTGGYFNPSLALAMELGCSGLAYQDFLIIYFGGPALATLLSVPLLRFIQPSSETVVVTAEDKTHVD